MPAVVAGLGGAAGGALGGWLNSLFNKPGPPGGGIDGVTSSIGGGKDGQKGAVPQVVPDKALEWYQQAADVQKQGYTMGLNYYLNSLASASKVITPYYNEAAKTLNTLSTASNEAMNEQMRMMGLNPISKTATAAKDVLDLIPWSSDLGVALNHAEGLKTDSERKIARDMIMKQFGSYIHQSTLAQDLAALGPRPNDKKEFNEKKIKNPKDLETAKKWYAKQVEAARQWDLKTQELKAKDAEQEAMNEVIRDFRDKWNMDYSKSYDAAYSPEQIEEKVTNLPGYQFQFGQGSAAIQRGAAAAGMLGSANTQAALVNFGQQLGQNYYSTYMNNLANITNEGSGATMQISNNQIQLGQYQAGLIQTAGLAQMQNQYDIADAQANSLYQQAATWYDAAKFNTLLQFNGDQNSQTRRYGLDSAAVAAAPGMAQAQNQRDKFNYGVYQNQQGGNAYNAAQMIPSQSGWAIGSNGWPQYFSGGKAQSYGGGGSGGYL